MKLAALLFAGLMLANSASPGGAFLAMELEVETDQPIVFEPLCLEGRWHPEMCPRAQWDI